MIKTSSSASAQEPASRSMMIFQTFRQVLPAFACIGLLFASVIALAPSPATAQVPPARALFLDLETVFTQSKVGQGIRQQLEVMLNELGARETAADEEFDARERALISEQQSGQGADLQARWDAIQFDKEGRARLFQVERTAINAASAEARRKVNSVLNEIMQEILVERGANMVMSVAAVHVGGVDYDITAEVIARLDKRMPTLRVERPQ